MDILSLIADTLMEMIMPMGLIERLPWVILNLICAALAWVGLCIITILDLKFAANLIAVMLVILIVKFSITSSNYFFRKFK